MRNILEKRILPILLCLVLTLTLCLTGCGSKSTAPEAPAAEQTDETAPAAEATESAAEAAPAEEADKAADVEPEAPEEELEEETTEEEEELEELDEEEFEEEEFEDEFLDLADGEELLDLADGEEDPDVLPQLESVYSDGWTICWYLCGSNLETFYGCASSDLAEAMAVSLPANVRLVIQTGGSYEWHNEMVSAGVIQRYLLDSNGLTLLDEQPDADMGASGTLSSFLTFCRDYFPSAHKGVVFWNHGGGSVTGAEFDETYGFDALTLNEFTSAFSSVYALSNANPPFDLIGFDTCLMATVDVASAFRSIGHYLVASEEVEPGCGWYYTGWLQALAGNPYMSGEDLGRAICDSYLQGCTEASTAGEITLSLTDLSKVGPLLEAYNALGNEALLTALDSPEFYPAFGREAARSESYGGNTPEQGYTNMVDLGHLVRNSRELLPENSQAVLDALAGCVLYKVNGPYRAEATGLSCYYSYSGDLNNFVGYTNVGASEPFKYLYAYGLAGKLSSAGEDYVNSIAPDTDAVTRQVPVLDSFDLSQVINAYVDADGYPVLELDPLFSAALREVRVRIRQAYLVSDEPMRVDIVSWGESDLVGRDWENGVFRAFFDGYWAALDGVALYMEVVYACEDYTLYSSPVLLNGELRNLQIVYEKETVELENGSVMTNFDWRILGAREPLDEETGMADKNLILLQPGDEIIPVYLVMQDAGTDGAAWEHYYQPENAVIYSDDADLDLLADFGTAVYDVDFEMVDSRNQKTYSDRFVVEISGYDVTVQLWDDYMADADNAISRWR